MKSILIGIIFCVVALVKADIINDKAIEVSGNIQCCRAASPIVMAISGLDENCESPQKVRIELWDYFTIFPNVRLYWLDTEKSSEYSFRWADGKFFDVKPFLKIHVECSDGTVLDENYDYMDTKPKKISQDVKVSMPRKS
uniref:Uncharacterized protein n=1 Tax=Panagrolaimus sp. ES5 TaxID=591445 RepID=A0AC34F331_9BILA